MECHVLIWQMSLQLSCGDIWPIWLLRPRQNGRRLAHDVFKCIFLSENVWILIKISLKFVPRGPINNIPSLVQVMAWRRLGDKPLSETMMVELLTHICVTRPRPQWVKDSNMCFCNIENFLKEEINERGFSNPHPRTVWYVFHGFDFKAQVYRSHYYFF